MFKIFYDGIDTDIPGTGGPGCVNYLSPTRRFLETAAVTILYAYVMRLSLPKLHLHDRLLSTECNTRRKYLLAIHCGVFTMELMYKMVSHSLLWVFNPCHALTVCQILLLACKPCKWNTAIFRLQLHMLNGPLLALAFPVLNTRLLPGEQVVYFIQHFLILLVPLAMLDQSTVYSVEPLDDLSWAFVSLCVQVFYHFLFLQPLALFTGINLNNILCPAVSDPFKGSHYRLIAMIHQPFLIIILGKCFTCFTLTWTGQSWPWSETPPVDPNPKPISTKTELLGPLFCASEPEMSSDFSFAPSTWFPTNFFGYDKPTGVRKFNATMPISTPNKVSTDPKASTSAITNRIRSTSTHAITSNN